MTKKFGTLNHGEKKLGNTPLLLLQKGIGNQAILRLMSSYNAADDSDYRNIGILQPNLEVSDPGDVYEQEADRFAEQVMLMAKPQIQRKCGCNGRCTRCQSEDQRLLTQDEKALQIKRTSIGTSSNLSQISTALSIDKVLSSPGQPLDSATRDFMEPRFGYDFSSVRIHSDQAAAQSAQEVNAHAYTVGHNIVFGSGKFEQGSHDKMRLLAHELTHVLQQGTGKVKAIQRDDLGSGTFALNSTSRENYSSFGFPQARMTTESIDNSTILQQAKADVEEKHFGLPELERCVLHCHFSSDADRRVYTKYFLEYYHRLTLGREIDPDQRDFQITHYEKLFQSTKNIGNQFIGSSFSTFGPFNAWTPDVNAWITAYQPCLVSAPSLTNAELIEHWQKVVTYLKARKRGQDAYYDYDNLKRRLANERRLRILAGHTWLADLDLKSIPDTIYELQSPGPLTVRVIVVNGSVAASEALPGGRIFVTRGQFNSFLLDRGIPFVDAEEFYRMQYPNDVVQPLDLLLPQPPPAVSPFDLSTNRTFGPDYGQSLGFASAAIGSGLYASPFDIMSRNRFLQQVYSPNVNVADPSSIRGAETNWRGPFWEVSMHSGSYAKMMSYKDLNTIAPNFPRFDITTRGSPDQLISVTHSMPDIITGDVDEGHYRTKFRAMTGNQQPQIMSNAIAMLNQNYNLSLGLGDVNVRNFLAVPDDHVQLVRSNIERGITGPRPGNFMQFIDASLRQNPITVQNLTISTWNDLQSARTSLAATDYQSVMQTLANSAGQRVIGVGMTTAEIREMMNIRAATQQFGPRAMNIIAAPEVLEMRRLIATGMDPATARATVARGGAGRSAVVGSVVSTGTSLYHLATADDITWKMMGQEFVNIGLGTAGAAGGAWLESEVNMGIMNPILNRAMSPAGGSSALLTGAGFATRGVTATGVGAVITPVMVLGGMGINELFFGADYTGIDYAAVGARTAISGAAAGGAGYLATVGVSTLAGSEVPIIGNLIGFAVGTIVYLLVDEAVGEDIETEVREGMGEFGCVGSQYENAK